MSDQQLRDELMTVFLADPVELWPTITLRPRHGMCMTVRG